ncbi:hypothetical protein Aspvir_002989 [Aspergillus viridinutans]|uniref:Uncharacterized protein n=1 Tax=Aspergillus viridinutans TaxID=75553 RepID=A0A9P3C4A3_ASPVI|nr:uncharacterized protein Aspvir_002989 [Aspergillus viridinutans]GIK07327.1 hypothetical protein Aspvir_002989 [Aspergillus viridinutans]
MRLLSLALLLSAAMALPSAEKSCSGVGFPCGNATVNAYDCCVPLVCAPGAVSPTPSLSASWIISIARMKADGTGTELATCLPTASFFFISQKRNVSVEDKRRGRGSIRQCQFAIRGWIRMDGQWFESIDNDRAADSG